MTHPPNALAEPIYEPAEVAQLTGLRRGQVSRWLFGYGYVYRDMRRQQEPLGHDRSQQRRASFLDLVELRAAKLFLDRGFSARKVRRAFLEAANVSSLRTVDTGLRP